MAQPRLAVPAHPRTIGPYRVVRELGRGGMGRVYEAVHGVLDKRVAVKVLRPHLQDDSVSLQRFLREGRAACHVEHPNVVDVHELGSDGGVPYLIMEMLEGDHLGARLRGGRPLPLEDLVRLLLPVVSAVSAAHAAGIVHRDLKPSNIMLSVSRSGAIVPKVLDFGTSKLRADDKEQLLTITGAVLGTLHYMSPEQTLAPQNADAKSDQYSLGVILYECSTGRKPFDGESGYELMHAIMTAPVAPPSSVNPALPGEFDAVVMRAMNRIPRRRYASLRDLAAALLPFAPSDVASSYRAELAAGPISATTSGSMEAGWEKGTEAGFVPTTSKGTLREPASRGGHVSASRSLRGAVLATTVVVCGILVASLLPMAGGAKPQEAPWSGRDSNARHGAAPAAKRLSVTTHAAAPPVVEPTPVAEHSVAEATPRTEDPVVEPAPAKVVTARKPDTQHALLRLAGAKRTSSAAHAPEPSTPAAPATKHVVPASPVLLGDNGAPILE